MKMVENCLFGLLIMTFTPCTSWAVISLFCKLRNKEADTRVQV
jgi:hypothetical protein